MDVRVPSVPAPLRITRGMWEDFLCDPVLAPWVIFGVKLDAFQAARLRYYWWSRTSLTRRAFRAGRRSASSCSSACAASCCRNMRRPFTIPFLKPAKILSGSIFKNFAPPSSGRSWVRLRPSTRRVEGRGRHGARWAASRRSFGMRASLLLPAPSFAKDAQTQASLRLNTLVVEEWTHIDASSDGINKAADRPHDAALLEPASPDLGQPYPLLGARADADAPGGQALQGPPAASEPGRPHLCELRLQLQGLFRPAEPYRQELPRGASHRGDGEQQAEHVHKVEWRGRVSGFGGRAGRAGSRRRRCCNAWPTAGRAA